MSKNGGKSAKSTPESAETVVFISGKFAFHTLKPKRKNNGGA
jgi:hypothetical protein